MSPIGTSIFNLLYLLAAQTCVNWNLIVLVAPGYLKILFIAYNPELIMISVGYYEQFYSVLIYVLKCDFLSYIYLD